MDKKQIRLHDLVPKTVKFKLKRFDDFEFILKPCTGAMLIDIKNKLGSVESLISIPSAENIAKLALMIMEYNSAVKFKKQKVKVIDVLTGDEEEVSIGGYKILMHSFESVEEQHTVYKCILLSLGYNEKNAQEVIDEMTKKITNVMNDAYDEIEKDAEKKREKKVS